MLHTSRTFGYEYDIKEADVVLLGVPFDSTCIGRPVKYGPLFIREALKGLEGFDPQTGFNPFSDLKFHDAGDIEVTPGNWKLISEKISDTVKEIYEKNPEVFLITLGGEHLLTLGVISALIDLLNDITVVHFDAHRDLLDDWCGEKYSHITWARRALEMDINIIQHGCRCWKPEENEIFIEKIKENKIKGSVYVSVDLDVLDPSICPEVGTPEPDGINLSEFLGILKKTFSNKVIGIDVVECASDRIGTNTALIGAQTIKKALCYRFSGNSTHS